MGPVYFWVLGHCLSPLGLCPSTNLPDTLPPGLVPCSSHPTPAGKESTYQGL